jgi:hypothetical protein
MNLDFLNELKTESKNTGIRGQIATEILGIYQDYLDKKITEKQYLDLLNELHSTYKELNSAEAEVALRIIIKAIDIFGYMPNGPL